MSEKIFNDIFRTQQKTLVRATFKKGFINAIHTGSRTVDVYYAENPQTIIRGVPIANNVDIATLMVNQRCRVDLFDETNPNDCVVAYAF